MEGSLWSSTGHWHVWRRPRLPHMLPTLQLQPWREWPTLGGQRELLKAISGVRDGLHQLLLAASSLCWTSPEDGLRHRDAAVCLHLASGSPSLLAVGGHTWAPARSPQCLGKGSSKGSVLGVLGDLPWRREQGRGFQPLLPPHSTQTQPRCLRTGVVSPLSGRRHSENGDLLPHQTGSSKGKGSVYSFRLRVACGQGPCPPSDWESLSCATAHL